MGFLNLELLHIVKGEKIIDLRECHFNETRIITLANALCDSKVEQLTLYGSDLDDHELERLAKILPRTKIYHLNLGATQVTHVGMQALLDPLRQSCVIDLRTPNDAQSHGMGAALAKICEENKKKHAKEMPLPPDTDIASSTPTTTVNTAEIIERQRRAALEDGQGI